MYFKNFEIRSRWTKNSDLFASKAYTILPLFWAKLGYPQIKIDHIADSFLKLQIKIGVHLINVELSQLLTLGWWYSLWKFWRIPQICWVVEIGGGTLVRPLRSLRLPRFSWGILLSKSISSFSSYSFVFVSFSRCFLNLLSN